MRSCFDLLRYCLTLLRAFVTRLREVHYCRPGGSGLLHPVPPQPWRVRTTPDMAKVTCPRCQRLLPAERAASARSPYAR